MMKLRIDSRYIPLLASAIVLLALYSAGCVAFADRNFISLSVVAKLFSDNAFLGIAAIGATFVILSGGIDLSVGSVVAFTSILIAALSFDPKLDPRLVGEIAQLLPPEWMPLHPLTAITIAIVLGTGFGTAMGCLIHFFKLPAFLVTLGGMFLVRGLAFMIRVEALSIKHPFYAKSLFWEPIDGISIPTTVKAFTWEPIEGVAIPLGVFCFLGLFLAALFIAHWRRFGRNVYAIGGSEESANLMGLPVARTRIMVYTFAGFCSSVAGVVWTFYTAQGSAAGAGVGLELDAIAAVIIGGTLLAGGVGFLAGTMIGVLIFALIQSLINFQGSLSAWWTRIVVGVLVLVFILLQNFVTAASRSQSKSE
jgi:ribose/xylose/arabinose/galactoside ABC-type transport system permease subunit